MSVAHLQSLLRLLQRSTQRVSLKDTTIPWGKGDLRVICIFGRGIEGLRMPDNEGILVREMMNCLLCGELGRVLYSNLRDRLFGVPGLWSILRCYECRHVWLNPSPAPNEMWKLYTSYHTHKPTEQIHGSLTATFRESAKRGLLYAMGYDVTRSTREKHIGKVLHLVPLLRELIGENVMFLEGPPGRRLLDVGCGNGSFLHRMRSLGWDVIGVEADKVAARAAQERYGLPVMEGPIEEVDLPTGAFDAITMNHVIEHVHDPLLVLKICRRSLRPGGTLVVKTPNVDSWGHRVFRDSWMPLDPPRHLHLFCVQTLRISVERAGLSVKSLHTSALNAPSVYYVSRVVRIRGSFNLSETLPRRTLGGYAFRFAENVIKSFRENAGEEIVLLATKGEV